MFFLLIYLSPLWLYWQDDIVKLEVHIKKHSAEMNTLHGKIDELKLYNDSSDKLLKKLIRDNQVRIRNGQKNIWDNSMNKYIQIKGTCYNKLEMNHNLYTKKKIKPANKLFVNTFWHVKFPHKKKENLELKWIF